MGCDIHVHIEVKINDQWHHYSVQKVNRWYALFGRINGVRDSSKEPICTHQGIPPDATFLTLYDHESWIDDLHHPGWLTREEAIVIEKEFGSIGEPVFGYIFGNCVDNYDEIQDIRVIFWFDN